MRRDRCVGVRDRDSGEWKSEHSALGSRLVGAVPPSGVAPVLDRWPEPGDRLCFGEMLVVTSPFESIRRPPREIVARYPAEARA